MLDLKNVNKWFNNETEKHTDDEYTEPLFKEYKKKLYQVEVKLLLRINQLFMTMANNDVFDLDKEMCKWFPNMSRQCIHHMLLRLELFGLVMTDNRNIHYVNPTTELGKRFLGSLDEAIKNNL